MSNWLHIRRTTNPSRKLWSNIIGESSVVDKINTTIERILEIKKCIYNPESNFGTKAGIREASWVRNDLIYNQGIATYNGGENYIKQIHDDLVLQVWIDINTIINRNLSSKEIRAINRSLATWINHTEMKLGPESKDIIQQAFWSKIGNRFDFVGPIQIN
jgi:hypothetical protein